ncbi:hypothetical protein L7F22_032451 [Adiantum nelumboides]|nr:hypothetical protein [Adiantum nelumboides]
MQSFLALVLAVPLLGISCIKCIPRDDTLESSSSSRRTYVNAYGKTPMVDSPRNEEHMAPSCCTLSIHCKKEHQASKCGDGTMVSRHSDNPYDGQAYHNGAANAAQDSKDCRLSSLGCIENPPPCVCTTNCSSSDRHSPSAAAAEVATSHGPKLRGSADGGKPKDNLYKGLHSRASPKSSLGLK